MTPGARHAAAIAVLDRWLAGEPAEQALTNWARGSRYAGSGDRAAVRDLVFDAVRCRRSFAALGGSATGRGLVLGGLRAAGTDPAAVFTGEGRAPAPPTADEAGAPAPADLPEAVALDCPDWLAPALRRDLGDDFVPVLQALRRRAPVFLRANLARATPAAARARLAAEGILAEPHPLAGTALAVTANARRIRSSSAFAEGLVDLQDAASQAVVEALDARPGMAVLDQCAGGGGKALALAALGARVTAHDADPARMRDLPARAGRAGVRIDLAEEPRGTFDLVLADAPCSGSGAWRRAPEGKWALTPDRLAGLTALQSRIMDEAARHVRPGGRFAYATCSLLSAENEAQADGFCARHPGFAPVTRRRWSPLEGGDGFFLCVFARAAR